MKIFRNIILLYVCFNLFGGNLISCICKIQSSFASVNMTEEEDDASPESKEDSSSKEEKLHCSFFELTAAFTYIQKQRIIPNSDDKMINHSYEIACPPPNC